MSGIICSYATMPIFTNGQIGWVICVIHISSITKPELINKVKKYVPYKTKSSAKEQKKKKHDNGLQEKLAKNTIEKIPEIIEALNKNFMEEWESLRETKIVGEIKDFGEEVEKLGNNYNLEFISQWGSEISHLAGSFDIENLSINLEKFPELIKKLKNYKS